MGAIPNKLPGFQDIEQDHEARERIGRLWDATIQPTTAQNLTQMLHAMWPPRADGAVRHRREPGAVRRRRAPRRGRRWRGLDHLVVQEIFLTRTAEFAHVVLPAAATWCEGEGTVTNSERRVQRVRKAIDPPAGATDELWIISRDRAPPRPRLGRADAPKQVWNEFRAVAPHFAGGMSYARLEALGGIQWPCPDESHPGETFLHGRLWEVPRRGRPAPFSVVQHEPPVERPDAEYPLLLTTGPPARVVQHRRADRRLRLAARTTARRSTSRPKTRRGSASPTAQPCRDRLAPRPRDRAGANRLRVFAPGMVFMTLHFPDEVRDQPADHRRLRSEVGDGGVQGVRGARRARPVEPERPRARGFRTDGHSARRRRAHGRRARGGRRAARRAGVLVGWRAAWHAA